MTKHGFSQTIKAEWAAKCTPNVADDTEQSIAEAWAEMQAEQGDNQGLDQFGNQEADYTRTWTGNDSFHALSIGWKPPWER